MEHWSDSSSALRGCWAGNYTHYQSLPQSGSAPETGSEVGLNAGGDMDGGWGSVLVLRLETWGHIDRLHSRSCDAADSQKLIQLAIVQNHWSHWVESLFLCIDSVSPSPPLFFVFTLIF